MTLCRQGLFDGEAAMGWLMEGATGGEEGACRAPFEAGGSVWVFVQGTCCPGFNAV